jgi:hypothetical protein
LQQAIAVVESLPLETQEVLVTLMQNRLQEKRRAILLAMVAESEQAFAAGDVKRGSVADLLAELNDEWN